MVKFLARFLHKLDEHISDEQMIAFIDGELSPRKQLEIHRHLESCWRCRAERQQIEATVFALVERRQQLLKRFLPLPPKGEERFISLLDQRIERQRQGYAAFFLSLLRRLSLESMNPIVASTLVILLAVGMLFLIWQRSPASLSAVDLLKQAQASERAAADQAQPGVIYQKLAIRSRGQVIERTLYRDRQKKRAVRAEHLEVRAQHMKQALEAAGLNWEAPLSALDYGRWRSTQANAKDDIRQSGDGLITLITTSSEGAISQESLTLRKSDFHAVNRTIDVRGDMRGDDHFEIAELSYAVLGWNEVNTALFDPLTSSPGPATLRLTAPPTMEQLDDAELGARLALHRLKADVSEQIQITRSQTAIHVNGVVDTNERKQKLSRELRQISHVVPSLFSMEELTARPSTAPRLATVQQYSASVEPAPLEKLFSESSRSADEMSQVSEQLLGAALAAQRASTVLSELSSRFSAEEKLSDSARNALGELVAGHASDLRSSLKIENRILQSLLSADGKDAQSVPPSGVTIARLAYYGARNVALCRELISADRASSRPAQSIVADMLATTAILNHTLALLAPEPEIHQ